MNQTLVPASCNLATERAIIGAAFTRHNIHYIYSQKIYNSLLTPYNKG